MIELVDTLKNIPYYWVDKKTLRGYWQPSKRMREAGFKLVCCGKDGTSAKIIAMQWNQRWQDHRAGKAVNHVPGWPPGSLGEAFEKFKRLGEWTRKKPRTREDWERGWVHISVNWGDIDPKTVTLDDLSLWYSNSDPAYKLGLVERAGVREAHRAVKIWRALWQVAAAMKYCAADDDPSFGIRRITPQPRSERWREGEIVRLVKRSLRMGYEDLACVIAILWDTQFSPVDGRTLVSRHVRRSVGRTIFDLTGKGDGRAKTDKPIIGTLCRRTERLFERHLAKITPDGAELHPETRLFRTRGGALYTKDLLAKEFRKVRTAEFDKSETRQLLDMRRSGAVEAIAGGVDPAALAQKMGNTIHQAKELQKAYLPVDQAVVSMADSARVTGRRRLRKFLDSKRS